MVLVVVVVEGEDLVLNCDRARDCGADGADPVDLFFVSIAFELICRACETAVVWVIGKRLYCTYSTTKKTREPPFGTVAYKTLQGSLFISTATSNAQSIRSTSISPGARPPKAINKE